MLPILWLAFEVKLIEIVGKSEGELIKFESGNLV